MEKNYLIIKDNKVVNITLSDPEHALSQGWILQENPDIGIGWTYENETFSPPPRDIEGEWNFVRNIRDTLLAESDIYILPDRWNSMSSEYQESWTTYRQLLRDIPQTYEEPQDVIWPVKPE